MQLLTKETDYAIRTLIYLAENKEEFISTHEISSAEDIPYQFLRRILLLLNKKGIIESKEGVSGGVRMKKEKRDIKVSSLIKIFQGEIELSSCMFRKKICKNRSTCVLRKKIKIIDNIVYKEFEKITIGKLLKEISGG